MDLDLVAVTKRLLLRHTLDSLESAILTEGTAPFSTKFQYFFSGRSKLSIDAVVTTSSINGDTNETQ